MVVKMRDDGERSFWQSELGSSNETVRFIETSSALGAALLADLIRQMYDLPTYGLKQVLLQQQEGAKF